MRLSFLLPILFLFIVSSIQAQSNHEKYTEESIYLKTGFFGEKYIKNGKSYSISLFDKSLDDEMKISTKASFVYKQYKTNRNISILIGTIGLASYLYGTSKLISGIDQSSTNIGFTAITLGIGAIVLSIPFKITSRNRLRKAIWIRNRDLLY